MPWRGCLGRDALAGMPWQEGPKLFDSSKFNKKRNDPAVFKFRGCPARDALAGMPW